MEDQRRERMEEKEFERMISAKTGDDKKEHLFDRFLAKDPPKKKGMDLLGSKF
jgi:hypothetical protein